MKKVYESYCLNKKSFYLFFIIYIGLIFSILTLFVSELNSATFPVIGHPELVTELTLLGNIIFVTISIVLILLLLIPPILLTIKAVKDKLNILQIFAIWMCTFIACISGFIIVCNGPRSIHKFIQSLIDFLYDKFDIFRTFSRFLM